MKSITRVISLLLALMLLISCLTVLALPANAADKDEEVRFTKKIVSVVYDNSGSMNTDERFKYAKYATQMLIALLGEKDNLIITPMNSYSSVEIDLSNPNRDEVVKTTMTSGLFTPSGGTPASSITSGIQQLTKRGLMDASNLANSLDNTEHWLVILTDGEFDEEATSAIKSRISSYPSLKTIFLGFGPAAPDLSNTDLASQYQFTAYKTSNSEQIINVMQKIANQLSGRYTLKKDSYTVKGKEVTVDLDKCEYSFKSVSAIVQNCDATLTSAAYNGKKISISQASVIVPDNGLGLKNGYSAVINGTPYLSGGKLVLTYSDAIDEDDLSILAEPALRIVSFLEYFDGSTWKKTDMQYVNANLSKGDKVRVGYEVYEQANGKPIDIDKVFGGSSSTVTYAGKSYTVGGDIPLVVGNNEIALSVSVMDGAYTMYDSFTCIIEENPTFYRVEAEHGDKISFATGKAEVTYTVYINNSPITSGELAKYKYEINATAPDGAKATVKATAGSDGKIKAEITAIEGNYGDYDIYFKISSQYGISRDYAHKMDYSMGTLSVECGTPQEVPKGASSQKVKFSMVLDGKKLTKAELAGYTFTATLTDPKGNTQDISATPEADGSIATQVNFPALAYGDYTVTFNVSNPKITPIVTTHTLKYYPGSAEVKGYCPDSFPAGQTTAKATYTIHIDGKKLDKNELSKYNWYLFAKKPDGTDAAIDYNVKDDGTIETTIKIGQMDFGAHEIQVVLEFSEECKYEAVNSIKNYPAQLSLTTLGTGTVSMSQHELIANELAVEFELMADGVDLVFDNGLSSYKLTVGSVDVSQYAALDGNKLSYAPKAEHFGGELPVGDQKITLKLSCAGFPNLTAEANATLDITETIYTVELADISKQHIDRFRLSEMDAALYFRVLRDGVPLPEDEITEAFESGKIKVKEEKGTFGWKFWLPVGSETYLETIDSETYVVLKATKDWIKPFDSYAAMLIFNGDRPVTVSYRDAACTGNLTFDASPVWSYIWRVLVILFIIHIILYVIGFFNGKCKTFPSGYFISATVTSDGSTVSLRTRAVNQTFWDKFGWHVWRFFPHKKTLWYHQPEQPGPYRTKYGFNPSGSPALYISEEKVELSPSSNGSEEGDAIEAFISTVRKYRGSSAPRMKTKLKGRDVKAYFQRTSSDPKAARTYVSVGTPYGTLKKDNLYTVVYFVRSSRRR